ncbi:MAG: M48 family metallopeptidase [Bacteroidota bacterium]|nr:M48 family metallopeptidase [Bacteroidota bacterium]
MKNKLFCLLWLSLFSAASHAQEYKSWFKTIAPLGSEFTDRSTVLANLELDKPAKKSKVNIKAFKESNDYFIDRFLNSGKVIAYSKANLYLDRVVDKLLANDPALRAKLKFYIVYTSEVNAFTFTNGMIFVNIGLFARFENEAQLAFILAHEIAHYTKKHAFERYKFSTESEVEDMGEEEFLEVVLSKFSRNQEFEADDIGFEIFRNSGYAQTEAASVFNILKISEYPVENKKIEKHVFEGPYLKVPSAYYPDSAIQMIISSDENDSTHTHPSSGKRQAALGKKMDANAASSGQTFRVDEQTFNQIKLASQFALSEILIQEKDYVSAIYNTELLLSRFPNHETLLSLKVKAYYFLLANIDAGSGSSVIKKPQRINGEIKKFHQLFKKLSLKETNTLALRIAWDIHLANPKNEEIKQFTHAITKLFAISVSTDLNQFAQSTEYDEALIASFYLQDTSQEFSKRKKFNSGSGAVIRKKKNQPKESFVKFAIPDLIENKEFRSVFTDIAKDVIAYKEANPDHIEQYDDAEEDISRSRPAPEEKKKKKKGSTKKIIEAQKPFTTDKLLIIDVSNIKLDLSSGSPVKFFSIKQKQKELVNTLQTCAKLTGINLTVFNPVDLIANDSQFYNDRNTLEAWKMERITNRHMEEVLPSNYQEIQDLCKRYDTKYVCFITTRNIILPINQSRLFLDVLYTVYNPPLFIYTMHSIFRYKRYSAIYMPVFDITSGKVVADYSSQYDYPDHPDLMKAEFYYFLNSIKK